MNSTQQVLTELNSSLDQLDTARITLAQAKEALTLASIEIDNVTNKLKSAKQCLVT